MKDKKAMTLDELIAKKTKKDEKQNAEELYELASGGCVTVQGAPDDVVMATVSKLDASNIDSLVSAYDYLIYNSVKELRDPALHEQLDIKDPIDVVASILDVTDRLELGTYLLDRAGLKETVDEVKK
ncbi:hypothetical protein ACYEXS_19685 [Paenibacillus sp. MAH-36]|uniref:Uncharacterized protein n=1 Tax=Paenibacillus violae TaxID=3077234 RepID=A0ABU3R7B4_9BACL|nr:hypothetical protein [Paenibacillus sp. PFR10]MDU0200165.1 hypothetical protein [Paenibacillus sp. PFR10]